MKSFTRPNGFRFRFRNPAVPPIVRAMAIIRILIALLCLALPAGAEPIRILAFGDSLVSGFGLTKREGFAPQMERWLRARGHDVRVGNAGVAGATTAQALARLPKAMKPRPDAAIVVIGGNDFAYGLPAVEARANLSAILSTFEVEGIPVLLVGLRIPLYFGPFRAIEYSAMYPSLARRHGVPLYPDYFASFRQSDEVEARRMWMLPDQIHPNARGIARVVAHMGPEVERLIGAAR